MNIQFSIDENIYAKENIIQAIEDYKDVTLIRYNANTLTVEWEDTVEIHEIFNEFSNYLIYLCN